MAIPFDPMASMLERVVAPNLLAMRKTALIQWSEILDRWREAETNYAETFDTVRLERLVEAALQSAQSLLQKWDPRFSLQVVRSLPNRVVATLCQFEASDTALLAQMLHTVGAVAGTASGVQWPRRDAEGETAILLKAGQLRELEVGIAEILGRFVGACHLLVWAQFWYRWAGKGKRIASPLQPLNKHGYKAIECWDGRSMLLVPSVELARDEAVEQAAKAYDERQRKDRAGIGRAGLLRPGISRPAERRYRLWRAVLVDPCRPVLPLSIPAMNIAFPTPNWYTVPDTEWWQTVVFLGTYFEPQLQARFGLSALELERGLTALGLVVERQAQCGYLSEGQWRGSEALVLQSPATGTLLKQAVSHLASILQRGMVRVTRAAFRDALAFELRGLGVTDETLAERFFRAFSGVPAPIGFSNPVLFWEQDEQTCVHDLTRIEIFLHDLLSAVTGGDGPVANVRGSVFEEQSRRALCESLALGEDRVPWESNRDVRSGGKNFGDVDFCFSVEDVLVNLDMKSWQRTSDSFIGHHHTIQTRCRDLVRHLERAERRGDVLLAKLNANGMRYRSCLTFLVVATPEYLDPRQAALRFGDPLAEPRVVTVNELCILVSDQERWHQLVSL